MMPDCAFQLASEGGDAFDYLVEIDNSTEPVYSIRQRDRLARRIQFYDRYQYLIDHRFRVLMVCDLAAVDDQFFLALAFFRRIVEGKCKPSIRGADAGTVFDDTSTDLSPVACNLSQLERARKWRLEDAI